MAAEQGAGRLVESVRFEGAAAGQQSSGMTSYDTMMMNKCQGVVRVSGCVRVCQGVRSNECQGAIRCR